MSDAVSFAELDGQHVELLPARTVLSMFSAQIPVGDASSGSNSGGTDSGGGLNFSEVFGLMRSGPDGSNADGSSGANNS